MEAFYDESGSPVLRGNELVKDVRIPRLVAGQFASRGIERRLCQAYKVSKRRQMDEAILAGCFAVELSADSRIQSARLAFGGLGARPVVRARKTEGFLEGRNWNWESIGGALKVLRQEFDVVEDELAGAEYRSDLVVNLVEKFYREFADTSDQRASPGSNGGDASRESPAASKAKGESGAAGDKDR
jgi:xanthine dehydrogenase small subunit